MMGVAMSVAYELSGVLLLITASRVHRRHVLLRCRLGWNLQVCFLQANG
jgi:hypothetical protein